VGVNDECSRQALTGVSLVSPGLQPGHIAKHCPNLAALAAYPPQGQLGMAAIIMDNSGL
jgi:hypothetical protein